MKYLALILSVILITAFSGIVSSISGVPVEGIALPLIGVNIAKATGLITMPLGVAFFDLSGYTVNNISYDDVEENMGGFPNTAYVAFLSEIATHPLLPDPDGEATATGLVELTGNYSMEADKYFKEIKVPPRTTSSQPEGQGEAGSKSFNNKGSFFVPGATKAERLGLMRIFNNAYGIIILPDHEGNRVQYGDEKRPCEFKVVGDGGQAPADRSGFTVEWSTDSFAPGWVYKGTIPLSGETLPAIS